MKKLFITKAKHTRLFLMSLMAAMSLTSLHAQSYLAPIAYEDTYPSSSTSIGSTTHTSAYSFATGMGSSGSTPVDIALSGWDAPGQPGTMCWRILQQGAPSIILNQGLISYAGCLDIEVGMLGSGATPGGYEVLVAYYRAGVGHFVDVYTLTLSGITFNYSVPLSTSPFYTRISMDSHLLYATAITWEDGGDIKTKMAVTASGTINFSGVLTLAGTTNMTEPDCAFSHTPMGGSLNVHYAYLDPTTNSITESSYDFWIMIYMLSGTVPVAVNDVNFLAGAAPAPVNIDCPDHYDVENWAYTYTDNNADISVRLVDFHSATPPTTRIVNDGSLGNFAINTSTNYNAVLSYDDPGGMNGRINVGWYTNNIDPATANAAGYIALTMREDGTGLLMPTDYQTIANIPTWASSTPKLAYTKMHHQSTFMYAIFPEIDPVNGFRMEHKYHPWGAPQFKGGTPGSSYTCNDEKKIREFEKRGSIVPHLSAYPNPFSDKLAVEIPAMLSLKEASVTVTNIVGKKYGTFTGKASEVNKFLSSLSPKLLSGTYLVNVNIEGATNETLKVVKAD